MTITYHPPHSSVIFVYITLVVMAMRGWIR